MPGAEPRCHQKVNKLFPGKPSIEMTITGNDNYWKPDNGNVATKAQCLPSGHRVKRRDKTTGKKRVVVKCEVVVRGMPGIGFHP
jgi:hypothetical protein